jgi:hypothetical protein
MERMQKFRLFNTGGMLNGRVTQKIYNADETGLFFRCPSNKTLSLKRVFSQWWKDCQGEPNSSVSLQCC